MVDKTHSRKTFVIDTSVLLYDKTSIHSFPNNDLIIPLVVLDELDRFKSKANIIGENARYVNRFLDNLRKDSSLHSGVFLKENNQLIRVEVNGKVSIPAGLISEHGDNRIIGLALYMRDKCNTPVIVVTKDINLRVKCDALGILAEDYYKDSVPQGSELYSGMREVLATSKQIDQIHSDSGLKVSELSEVLHPNELIVVKSTTCDNHGTLAINKVEGLFPVNSELGGGMQIKPRNKEQKFALHLMTDPSIPLVTLTGIAGSGKTFLALMTGLAGIWDGTYKRVVITRPIVPVGRELGFLPGDVDDKMAPWLTPIVDNFRDGAPDKGATYFEMMKDRGEIEIAPLSFIRGRTFNDAFMIVDEAQNATIHELKTIITRVGQNSKLVLLGDTDQVDTPYIDTMSNGLSIVSERFKDRWLAGHIRLPKGERSDLATLASQIL